MPRTTANIYTESVRQAQHALSMFKCEVAAKLGINPLYKTGYWGNVSSREGGPTGGYPVRKLLASAEQGLLKRSFQMF